MSHPRGDPTEEPNPLFANLILLGTVHRDPLGMARLAQFYRTYVPDCILLEFSRHGLDFRLENQSRLHKSLKDNLRQVSLESGVSLKALIKHPQVAAIRRQISLPFEFRASRQYSMAKGIPVCLIDRSDFSRQWIRAWPELIAPQNLRFLVSTQLRAQGSCSCQYEQAAFLMRIVRPGHSRCCLKASFSKDVVRVKRERHLARKVEAILRRWQPGRPVFVGGWQHVVPGQYQPALRDYLNAQAHQCILLDRASPGPQGFPRGDPVERSIPGEYTFPGK